jgi:hypothetical protein
VYIYGNTGKPEMIMGGHVGTASAMRRARRGDKLFGGSAKCSMFNVFNVFLWYYMESNNTRKDPAHVVDLPCRVCGQWEEEGEARETLLAGRVPVLSPLSGVPPRRGIGVPRHAKLGNRIQSYGT